MTVADVPAARLGGGLGRTESVHPGPGSLALARRRGAAVARGVSSILGVYADRGEGPFLGDVDGNRLIDLGSGIAVTSVGHRQESIVRAVAEQADRFTHTCFMVTPYESYIAVCEELAELTPGGHEKRSALFTSGAEAVENAIKVARSATGRPGVAVLEHAFHGRTNLTMALTAKEVPYKQGFGPFAPEIYRAPTSYPFRDPEGMTGSEAAVRAIAELDRKVAPEELAALIVEPIQGEGGFIVPAPGFLSQLSKWCREHGIVFIADEIQTGFARTGAWFASEHDGVVPDIVVTAKGIAAGLPLSGITGRAELMDSVPPGGIGGTYGGNPVACAAALASIALIRDLDLNKRAKVLEDEGLPVLGLLRDQFATIGDIRGRGAMLAVEFVSPGSKVADPEITQRVARSCHAAGVLVLTCGTERNVVRLLPPLTITSDLWSEGLGVLADAIAANS